MIIWREIDRLINEYRQNVPAETIPNMPNRLEIPMYRKKEFEEGIEKLPKINTLNKPGDGFAYSTYKGMRISYGKHLRVFRIDKIEKGKP